MLTIEIKEQGLNINFNVQKTNIIRDFLEDIEEEPAPRYHNSKNGLPFSLLLCRVLIAAISPCLFLACDSSPQLHVAPFRHILIVRGLVTACLGTRHNSTNTDKS